MYYHRPAPSICIRVILSLVTAMSFTYHLYGQHAGSFVLGHIDQLQSTILGETRVLNIYLPEGYVQNDTAGYPVIYLLDGSADEDFVHVAGLIQFSTMSWVNRMPPSILVGIANTDRRRDFSFPTTIAADKDLFPTTGKSADFIRFLADELQPYIKKQYRTNNSKTIIGQSLGGLLATEILLKQPNLFTEYIIISPSLWWDNGSLLTYDAAIFKSDFTETVNVYIGVGKEGLTPGQFPRVMEVDANLLYDLILQKKAPAVNVHFDYMPDENHATVSHQAVYNAIGILFASAIKK